MRKIKKEGRDEANRTKLGPKSVALCCVFRCVILDEGDLF